MKLQNKILFRTFLFPLFFIGLLFPFSFSQAAKIDCSCNTTANDCQTFQVPDGGCTLAACKAKFGTETKSAVPADSGGSVAVKCAGTHKIFLEAAAAKTAVPVAKPTAYITPILNVQIPGLIFNNPKLTDEGIESTFLADYLTGLYRFLIGASITIAIVMVMIGGFQYVLSAGGADAGKAKTRISNATIGLTLLLSVYLILYTTNPQMTIFSKIKLQNVSMVDLPASHSGNLTGGAKGPKCLGKKIEPPESAGIGTPTFGPLEPFACGNRPLTQIKYLLIHEGGGDGSTIGILKSRGYSTHFVIERDGTIKQTIDLRTIAIHAGSLNSFSVGVDLAIKKGCSQSGSCVKSLECSSKCDYEPAQYASLNNLISSLSGKTGIKKDDEHIIVHCQGFDATHGDARNLDWAKLGLDPTKHREDNNIVNGKCIKSFTEAKMLALKKELYNKTKEPIPGSTKVDTSLCCTLKSKEKVTVPTEQDCTSQPNAISVEPGSC